MFHRDKTKQYKFYMYIYIYIYIDRYRERERDTMREEREGVSTYSEVEACRTQPS